MSSVCTILRRCSSGNKATYVARFFLQSLLAASNALSLGIYIIDDMSDNIHIKAIIKLRLPSISSCYIILFIQNEHYI